MIRVPGKYETFWPRFIAGIYDGLILLPLTWGADFLVDRLAWPWPALFLYVPASFLYYAYSIWMHGRYGWTLGKRAAGVRVLDLSERPLSMRQAAFRDLVPVCLTVIGLAFEIPDRSFGGGEETGVLLVGWSLVALSGMLWFLAELITMLTNSKRRAIHDFIAGSVVIRAEYPVRPAA
ncbi:MAG: RDD family protein [Planctomycetota bacterium]|nr:RDD family protein [Planctomycetota bacterium]